MQTVHVNTSKPYDVFIGSGAAFNRKIVLNGVKKAMIVTDSNVRGLYLDKLSDALKGCAEIHAFVMGAGEDFKTERTVFSIIAELSARGFTRGDMVIALGGGVVGDTAGFAASIFMRGIRYVQIPTTLLSAIDSSVGGKTAVNVGGIKNVAGTFYQPEAVYIDPDIIGRIGGELFRDGMGEGVKYAILAGGRLAELVETHAVKDNLADFIALSVKCKADVASADEFEGGLRRVLNLGHTVAHAIETLSAHSVSHGRAVALGIVKISRAANKLGLMDAKLLADIERLVGQYFSDIEYEMDAEEAMNVIMKDKKCIGGKIAVVIPTSIGGVEIIELEPDKLLGALK